MRYIEEFREGDMIQSVYLCKNKTVAKTKAGKSYYSMQLQDKTGSIDAKIWDLTNGIGHFDSMDYIQIDGQVTSFQGALQLNVKRVRIADEGEYIPSDYMPCSKYDIEVMFGELTALINSVKNKYLHALLTDIFVTDKAFAKSFKSNSAAKSVHHGFVGGLLEHSLSVAKLCDFMTTRYPMLNRDILITAAICHDIGKVGEIAPFPLNDYTDEGQLIGHIVSGTMMLSSRIEKIEGFPVNLKNELLHCILSHHGELEFGSPKKPALMEAVALAYADNIDAKMQTFTEILETNKDNKDWFGFNRLFESNLKHTVEE